MAISSEELGAKLCGLFGLDPNQVRKIVIVAEAGEAATVVVEQSVPDGVETVLREYELKAKD